MPTKEKINCYNDPNWIDEALKRCSHFESVYSWRCSMCCNYSICHKFRQEAREKAVAEMREQLLELKELKVQMCEPESNLNGSVRSIDTLGSLCTQGEFYVRDLAAETPIVSYDMNIETWRVVDEIAGTTTIRYVSDPDW